jgi:hypothetical protein
MLIAKPREFVWDYTQDYSKRMKWDSGVLETKILQTEPNLVVKLKTKGSTTMTFVYKLFDKPNKTSLVAREIKSPIIESAGGSWAYEDQNGGTLWTQTNTIKFKKNFILPLLLPLYRSMFQSQTKKAMRKAKALME